MTKLVETQNSNSLIIITITKVLNVHDPMIGMMGALSWVTSFMVWALATQGWMMYMATGLSSIGIIPVSITMMMGLIIMIISMILGHIQYSVGKCNTRLENVLDSLQSV